jgi:WD40 repeat protein
MRAFTGSKDRTVKVWDPRTGKEVLTLHGHAQEVTVVAMSPDNRRLLTAARDGSAILWQSEAWKSPDGAKEPAKPLAAR